jgi:hypothetical protein
MNSFLRTITMYFTLSRRPGLPRWRTALTCWADVSSNPRLECVALRSWAQSFLRMMSASRPICITDVWRHNANITPRCRRSHNESKRARYYRDPHYRNLKGQTLRSHTRLTQQSQITHDPSASPARIAPASDTPGETTPHNRESSTPGTPNNLHDRTSGDPPMATPTALRRS